MAYLRYFRFVVEFQSLITLILIVPATQEYSLSVQAPTVYSSAGQRLKLVCFVNETVLSPSRVSWKHHGKWLHNRTTVINSQVRLEFKSIRREDAGVYQCAVYNLLGETIGRPFPKEENVSLLVGGPISKPVCISIKWPPETMLLWNPVDFYEPSTFTYSVFYCSSPSFTKNRFCSQPPLGYKSSNCTNLTVHTDSTSKTSSNTVLECNVTSVIKTLFPNFFDPHAPSPGGSVVVFSIKLGDVFSDRYGPTSTCRITSSSSPAGLRKCTKPRNVHILPHMRRALSVVWDAPSDMGEMETLLSYVIIFAREGETANQTLEDPYYEPNKVANINVNITSLEPYSLYHLYIACSLKGSFSPYTLGEFIGPYSATTLEEEPSGQPEVMNYWSDKIYEHLRNVTVQWKLPDNKTWNGIISHFVIEFWRIMNSTSSERNKSHVMVFSNVSMTTGRLTNLAVDENYAVTVRMCTLVGCGPPSSERHVERLSSGATTKRYHQGSRSNLSLIVGVTVPLLVCAVFALLVSWLLQRSRRKQLQQKRRRLSEAIGDLSPPHGYEYPDEPAKSVNSGEYDKVETPLLFGRGEDPGEYVAIKEAPPEPGNQTKIERRGDTRTRLSSVV